MKRVTALAGLCVASCATPQQLLNKPPIFTVYSQQSPDRLEECIGLALGSAALSPTMRGEERRTIFMGTAAAVTIIYGPPEQIKVRQSAALNKKYRDEIRRCAATGSAAKP